MRFFFQQTERLSGVVVRKTRADRNILISGLMLHFIRLDKTLAAPPPPCMRCFDERKGCVNEEGAELLATNQLDNKNLFAYISSVS